MKNKIIAIFVMGLVLFISGCVEEPDDGEDVTTESSFTEVRIGDKPTEDFSHINITFSEVKLHSEEFGWRVINSNETTIDLIDLHKNNETEQLGLEEIEAGNYTKLWIVVVNASGVLNSTGEMIYFDVPSNTLKLQHLFEFTAGNNTITVDIDLDNSIVELGNGEAYKLLPVIGALRVKYEAGNTVRIQDKDQLKSMTENRAPAVDIIVDNIRGNHLSTEVNTSITFDASGSFDIEGDTITFSWDFGDESSGSGAIVNHSYQESGTYQVILTVSDGELEDTGKIIVTVNKSEGQGNSP